MNAEQLNAIKERATKATHGPWYHNRHNEISTPNGARLAQAVTGLDATFIAHAREDVPALVAEVERLQNRCELYEVARRNDGKMIEYKDAEIERLRKALEYYADRSIYEYELNNAPWWTEFKEPNVDDGYLAREALK